MGQYLPIIFLLGVCAIFGSISIMVSRLLNVPRPTAAKIAPYECGITDITPPPERFPVRFYLIAMIFIVFDIEIIFLYPFAMIFRGLGTFGLIAIVIFAAAVFESFVYLIANGVLDWGPVKRLRHSHMVDPARTARTTVRRVGLEGRDHRDVAASPTVDDDDVSHDPIAVPVGVLMGIVDDVRAEGFAGLDHNFLTGKLEDLVKWARIRSCMPATFGLACCAIEMMGAGGPHYDLARFGMETFRASPRQADLMIVAGRLSQKMAPVLRTIYDQMMEPKWVISMGVCASTGGMFNNYALVQGVDQIVPVDVYAPGCPPGPETLLHAIITLHDQIRAGEITRRRTDNGGGAGIELEVPVSETAQPVHIGTR